MRVVVFFMSLCFFLLGGDAYATPVHTGVGYSTAPDCKTRQQVIGTNAAHSLGTTFYDGFAQDETSLYCLSDDVEEDEDNPSPGKYLVLAASGLTCLSQHSSCIYHRSLSAIPTFYGRPSCIYITHRVLRL